MEIKSGVSRLEELVKDIVANQHIAFDLQRKDESEMQKLQDDMVNLQSVCVLVYLQGFAAHK